MPNPLNLELATGLKDKVERVDAEIVSLDELEEMSLAEINQAKVELEKRRNKLQLRLDKRKLKQAESIMDIMDGTLDAMIAKLSMDDVPARDLNDLSKTYSEMLKSLNTISRLDSVDGRGTAQMIHIEVRTQG